MKNKKNAEVLLYGLLLLLLLTGCGSKEKEGSSEEYGMQSAGRKPVLESTGSGSADTKSEPEIVGSELGSESSELESMCSEPESKEPESEVLLDAFLADEIPVLYNNGEKTFMISDLLSEEEDYFTYSLGERVDLDNDGEAEQILNGPYGGLYIDARDGMVYILAEGEGTTGVLFYTNFDHAVWIVHCDTTHAGRQMYWLEKYDGSGNIVDEFQLSAEYWDSPGDTYDENSDFIYRGEKITMTEFETLRAEILDMQ